MSPTTAAQQAEQLRKDGNLYFEKDRLGAAIDAYTEAITLCPDVVVYWTNRALCHRKRNEWVRVEEDCRRAIQLDHNSVKAHFMLGLALVQKKELEEGVKELEKALDLGRGANPQSYVVEEIWQELAKAKYSLWELKSIKQHSSLKILKEICIDALVEKVIRGDETKGSVDETEGSVDETDFISHLFEVLNMVFDKAKKEDTPTEVPDHLCCRITLDIFRDPVITPSGVTYERAVILEHLEKVGRFDPVSREALNPSQLVPNLAIKEAVRAFLDVHGWAYKVD